MNGLKIVALAGGVGGAKLADGLVQVNRPDELTVVVNTADDFTHLGLRISPDLDTVCYTLAGLANPETGWGRDNETWNVFTELKQLGMPDWFQLGDSDIATHIYRTEKLIAGCSLSQITKDLCQNWGIQVQVLPMSDQIIQTMVVSDDVVLEFQEYFVHQKCAPFVRGFKFNGIDSSLPAPGLLAAIEKADAVVICPSNPWVSIDPILSVPGIRAAIEGHLVVAVSPIVGNRTIKGPAAKMFRELGIEPSAFAVAKHYGSIINGIIIDITDTEMINKISNQGIRVYTTDIVMHDRKDRGRLAAEIINLIKNWEKVN